jgi:hypothetical protein
VTQAFEVGSFRFIRPSGKVGVNDNDSTRTPGAFAEPMVRPFRDLPRTGRLVGYAGPPNRNAAEVVTKYIIVDMYAKAIQGMAAEDAVKWADDEIVKIYR